MFFKGKSPGVTKIEFLPSSLVLANDARGTNVLRDLGAVSYLILPEKISKDEESQQKNMIIQPEVMGEKTEQTKMIFYEENKTLGIETSKAPEKNTKPSFFGKCLGLLEKINCFILTFWGEIVPSLFKRT